MDKTIEKIKMNRNDVQMEGIGKIMYITFVSYSNTRP